MRTYALVVGIDHYPAVPTLGLLKGAVADACDFADWALAKDGGRVAHKDLYFWSYPWPVPRPANGKDPISKRLRNFLEDPDPEGPPNWDNVLIGSSPPDQSRPPLASEIVKTMEAVGRAHFLAREYGQEVEPSRVFVFFAGHGVIARPEGSLTEETCFIATDFRSSGDDMATGLVACESLKRSLRSKRFDEALFFLDCCRVQTSTLSVRAAPLAAPADEATNWTLAYAAQNKEPAFETLTPPIRGAFSSALMDGLRTCRDDPGDHLSSGRLRTYVRANIATYTNSGQMPRVLFLPDDDVGLVVVEGPATAAPTATTPPAPTLYPGPLADLAKLQPGTKLVLKNGPDPVPGFVQIDAAPDPVQLPDLPEGVYSLEMVGDGQRHALFRVPGTEQISVE